MHKSPVIISNKIQINRLLPYVNLQCTNFTVIIISSKIQTLQVELGGEVVTVEGVARVYLRPSRIHSSLPREQRLINLSILEEKERITGIASLLN